MSKFLALFNKKSRRLAAHDVFQFRNSSDQWENYSPEDQKLLQTAYLEEKDSVELASGMMIDFKKMKASLKKKDQKDVRIFSQAICEYGLDCIETTPEHRTSFFHRQESKILLEKLKQFSLEDSITLSELPQGPPLPREHPLNHTTAELKPSDILVSDRMLGQGGNAHVYYGGLKGKDELKVVAVKVLKSTDDTEITEFYKEVLIFRAIQHENLTALYGICCNPKLTMVMELCSRGDVHSLISKAEGEFGWPEAGKCIIGMCRGIAALHNNRPPIIHRDLKSQNLLITQDWVVKVTDFGLSRLVEDEKMKTLQQCRGTARFIAPEVFSQMETTVKSDIFSIGVTMWEIATRAATGKYEVPFREFGAKLEGGSVQFKVIAKGKRPTLSPQIPQDLATLISQCWASEPRDRPEISAVLKIVEAHSFEH